MAESFQAELTSGKAYKAPRETVLRSIILVDVSPARSSTFTRARSALRSVMSAAVISAQSLVVRYGAQTVLRKASLTIHEGERIGLVGRNGSGKSTLLEILAGAQAPDQGEVVRRRNLEIGYMPQRMELAVELDVQSNIAAGAGALIRMIEAYESSSQKPESALFDQIMQRDGWNLDYQIKSLAENLHAPDLDRLVGQLSGGEQRRVALCRALISHPDLLILDEPTNHLDTDSIEWLERYLDKYSGTCLFVTHDRYFLDRVATHIVELSRGEILRYEGNYTDYLLARAARHSAEEIQEKKRQKFIRRELEWVRRSPEARRTKSIARVERYFELASESPREIEPSVELIIPPPPRLSERVIELAEISYVIGERTLIDRLSLDLQPGERLGIVGPNGAGKSTLLRLLLGQIKPSLGHVLTGPRTLINYVDQSRAELDESRTVWEEAGENSEVVQLGDEKISLRAYLRRFLFTEDQINTKISLLSGGEKSRLLLAKILKRGGNVLLLDEPTNDLDLGTLRLLEEALAGFGGTVVVVSHDRYFLNRVCTSILAFEGSGTIRYSVGNYDYYLEKRPPPAPEVERPKPVPTPASPTKRKLKWKEARELGTIEDRIATAEREVTRLEATFAEPDFYEKRGARWQEIEDQLRQAKDLVALLYARWEELELLAKPATEHEAR